MARWRTVARWFIDRRFQLTYLNEEALVVPRACDKPEFGPCALVAATLLTDWGRDINSNDCVGDLNRRPWGDENVQNYTAP